jgi:hypothetical protein
MLNNFRHKNPNEVDQINVISRYIHFCGLLLGHFQLLKPRSSGFPPHLARLSS